MGCLWNKCANDYESSAKVVDGNLILSLPDAVNPIVWRMELGSVKASALEVRSATPDGTFTLALKTPKGDVHDIAPFDSREKAVHALMCVSKAMQGAEGRMNISTLQTTHANSNEEKKGSAFKWILAIGLVLLVIFLFSYLGSIQPRMGDAGGIGDATPTGTAGSTTDGESGVPQSADQMLKGF